MRQPTYLYVPVAASDLIGMAENWDNQRHAAGKGRFKRIIIGDHGATKNLRRKLGIGKLTDIGAAEKLCVLAHGQTRAIPFALCEPSPLDPRFRDRITPKYLREDGPRTVGGKVDGERKAWTPAHLAQHLQSENLTKRITKITLYCCGAASRPNDESHSFAFLFVRAMRDLGFHHVIVTAYQVSIREGVGEFKREDGTKFKGHVGETSSGDEHLAPYGRLFGTRSALPPDHD